MASIPGGLSDISVTIGGDLSDLDAALAAIPAQAAQAGAQVNQALGSSLDGASQSLGNLSGSISHTGASAASAAPQIEQMSAGIAQTGEEAEKAGGFSEYLATSFEHVAVRITEALALYELIAAVKDFATEAVRAADEEERFTISMGALTGSMTQGREQLEAIKAVGMSMGIAFDPLEQAAVRMTALGLSSSQTTTLLRAAGDASAAVGQDFQTITRMMEMAVTSGNLMTRSLASMGLSVSDLAKAMNVAEPDVTKAFKALDQSQRIEVLSQALAKFGGIAEMQAETISGAATRIADQWQEMEEKVGNALTPLIKELLDFTASNVIPFIEDLTHDFEQLGSVVGPALVAEFEDLVKSIEGVVEAGRAMTSWLSTISGYISGITEFESILSKLSGSTKDSGESAVTAADAFDKFRQYIQMGLNPLQAFGLAAQQLHSIFSDLANEADVAATAMQLASTRNSAATQALASQLTQLAEQANAHAIAVGKVGAEYEVLKQALVDAKTNLANVTEAYRAGNASAGQLQAAQAKVDAATKALDGTLAAHAATLADITKQYAENQTTVKEAAATLAQAKAGYEAGSVSLGVYLVALDLYNKDLQAADPLMKQHLQSLSSIGAAYDEMQTKVHLAKTVLDQAAQSLEQTRIATSGAIDAIEIFNGAQQVATVNVRATKAALDAAHDSLQAQAIAHADLEKALAADSTAAENYLNELKKLNNFAGEHIQTLDEMNTKYDQWTLAVQAAQQAVGDAQAKLDGSQKSIEIYQTALDQLAKAQQKLTQYTQESATATAQQAQTSDAATAAVGRHAQANTNLGLVVEATTKHLQVHVESLQQMIDHENAVQTAVQMAADVLDQARLSYDGSAASMQVLNSAEQQLINLLKGADPELRQQILDMNGLSDAATNVGHAVRSAGQAMSDFGTSVAVSTQDLHAMFDAFQGNPAFWSGLMNLEATSGLLNTIGPGFNATVINGVAIGGAGGSLVNPGTMGPVAGSSAASAVASISSAVSGLPTVTYNLQNASSSIASAATAINNSSTGLTTASQSLATATTTGGLPITLYGAASALQQASTTVSNAWSRVAGAMDAHAAIWGSVTTGLIPYINAGIVASNAIHDMGVAATQALTSVASTMTTVGGTVAGVAAALNLGPAATPNVAASAPGVTGLTAGGALMGAPSGIMSPYVGSGPLVQVTVQGNVVGQNGIQQLADTVQRAIVQNLKTTAGLKIF